MSNVVPLLLVPTLAAAPTIITQKLTAAEPSCCTALGSLNIGARCAAYCHRRCSLRGAATRHYSRR